MKTNDALESEIIQEDSNEASPDVTKTGRLKQTPMVVVTTMDEQEAKPKTRLNQVNVQNIKMED